MKRERKDKRNKQNLHGVIACTLLIILSIILPGVVADSATLPTRGNPGMAYDSESDKIVIFGGFNATTTPGSDPRDTWLYDFNTDTYIKNTPSPAPRRRAEGEMVYDSLRDQIILFGGMENFTGNGERDDTWTYDENTNTWTELFPVSAPSARRGHIMAYDSESDRIVLFGGIVGWPLGLATFYNETWVYNPGNNTWQQMSPALAPQTSITHHMTYDSESDRMILFGGVSDDRLESLYETWAYDYNSDTWEELTNDTHPSGRSSHIMAYDSESDRIVLFGGGNFSSTNDETWIYDYNTNSWEEMNPTTSPSARVRHEAAYDSESDRVIIYGGTIGPFDSGMILISTGKTWAYDLNTNSWVEVDEGAPYEPPLKYLPLILIISTPFVGIAVYVIIKNRKLSKKVREELDST